MKVEGAGQIVRHNYYFDNLFDVITTTIRVDRNGRGIHFAKDSHIYHNTFFDNGGAVWVVQDYANLAGQLDNNVFMNNLLFQNRQTVSYTDTDDADIHMVGGGSGTAVSESNKVFKL